MSNVTRGELIGKRVYNPDGSYLGEVLDIGFAVGGSSFVLYVMTSSQAAFEVPWEKVSGAKDILLLKENFDQSKATRATLPGQSATTQASVSTNFTPTVQSERPAMAERPQQQAPITTREEVSRSSGVTGVFGRKQAASTQVCPSCGKNATWIKEYQRWYCYNCQKYV